MASYQYVYHMDGVSKTYPGGKKCFENIRLSFLPGVKIGVVGVNGAGKSTLMKIMAGLDKDFSGEAWAAEGAKVGYLPQEPHLDDSLTVRENVMLGVAEKKAVLDRYNELAMNYSDETADEMAQLQDQIDAENLWDLDSQIDVSMEALRCPPDEADVATLSGGERRRVALCKLLLEAPEMLLLDEPTNHLDAAAVEWLQSWLDRYPGAVVLVTHDRYVLDRVTRRIVEVERGQASSIDGNYSAYLQRKADQEVSEAAEAARFKSVMRRELAWLRQGPKARSTKQKARIQRIEEMRAAPPKTNRSQLEMSSVSRRIGKLAIEAEQLTVTADGQVDGPVLLKDFTYSFSPEDRVGIIGPNGSGKSTLLDLIAGRRQATAGSLRLGETVHLGYLDQHTDALTEGRGLERKVIEFVEEAASRIDLGGEQLSASQLLERFLFPPAQQHSPLSKLSGGERRRLSLCRMLIQAPNVLLLDEPTNDLDVQTLSVLEDLLEDFRGCVVVVSHDRYFLDRTVDRLFCFEQGRLQRFEGNYSAFLDHRRNQEKSAAAEGNRNRSNEEQTSKELASKSQGPRRRSFKESRELESLEHELPQMEQRKADLEQAISSGQGDLTSLSHDLASLLEALETSEERWLELSELVP